MKNDLNIRNIIIIWDMQCMRKVKGIGVSTIHFGIFSSNFRKPFQLPAFNAPGFYFRNYWLSPNKIGVNPLFKAILATFIESSKI